MEYCVPSYFPSWHICAGQSSRWVVCPKHPGSSRPTVWTLPGMVKHSTCVATTGLIECILHRFPRKLMWKIKIGLHSECCKKKKKRQKQWTIKLKTPDGALSINDKGLFLKLSWFYFQLVFNKKPHTFDASLSVPHNLRNLLIFCEKLTLHFSIFHYSSCCFI